MVCILGPASKKSTLSAHYTILVVVLIPTCISNNAKQKQKGLCIKNEKTNLKKYSKLKLIVLYFLKYLLRIKVVIDLFINL